jgi:hypothetical protein
MRPFQQASNAEEELEERFGNQRDFVPPLDGVVSEDRWQQFLAVRADLQGLCSAFARAEERLAEVEDLDHEDDISTSQAMGAAVGAVRGAFSLPSLLGRHFRIRNESLLEHEMGLGEYTYLYLTAYRQQLLDIRENPTILADDVVSRRVQRAFREMTRAHLEALPESEAELRLLLEAELQALRDHPRRHPWEDGVPEPLAASLEPFRDDLERAFCRASAPLELQRNEQRGFVIETH